MKNLPDTVQKKYRAMLDYLSSSLREHPGTDTITGTVFKDEDGDGKYNAQHDVSIPGAIVSAWSDGKLIAATHADNLGRYTLPIANVRHCSLEVYSTAGVCYDAELQFWGPWSAVKGGREIIQYPYGIQDISVEYRMLNYGAGDFSWELWHKGPVFAGKNIILVHGFRLPGASKKGKCDHQFGRLDDLLQTKEYHYNVWQFEYADRSRGTLRTVSTYAARFASAIDKVCKLTGKDACSVIGYSMGGIIARQYIATAGGGRIDKLMTLATPHMGTIRFTPFNLKWSDKLLPRAGIELRPDSRFLWDLNTNIESSSIAELAAVGGHAWGHNDGFIEMSSTIPVKFNPDGTVAGDYYFAAVNRSHTDINRIESVKDEVFQLIHSFLDNGIQGIRRIRPDEKPGDYRVPSLLTFTLKVKPKWRMLYPFITIMETKRHYWGFRVFSQGARTKEDSLIFTVQLRPDDAGDIRIYYAHDKYATVKVQSGQSALIMKPLDSGFTVPKKSTTKKSLIEATG